MEPEGKGVGEKDWNKKNSGYPADHFDRGKLLQKDNFLQQQKQKLETYSTHHFRKVESMYTRRLLYAVSERDVQKCRRGCFLPLPRFQFCCHDDHDVRVDGEHDRFHVLYVHCDVYAEPGYAQEQ